MMNITVTVLHGNIEREKFMDSYEINKTLMKSNVSKKQLIKIMYDALSIMQRYNGNTVGCE